MISSIISSIALGSLALSQVSAQSSVPAFNYGTPSTSANGVVAQGSMGPTNPAEPMLGTPINQTSDARLVSVNSIDDWCLFGPDTSRVIADIEGETVAVSFGCVPEIDLPLLLNLLYLSIPPIVVYQAS